MSADSQRTTESGKPLPLFPEPISPEPLLNARLASPGTVSRHGACWEWCMNDCDGSAAPGWTGKPREGWPGVDDHGTACVNDGPAVDARLASGERAVVSTASLLAYHHGVYERSAVVNVGERFVRLEVERHPDQLLTEVFLDPGTARSLAAALIREADLLELPYGRHRRL